MSPPENQKSVHNKFFLEVLSEIQGINLPESNGEEKMDIPVDPTPTR